ncbi:YraN family protein [Flagellimonas sp.]|uniref:YraN family protein n=1 Tax=Flagellimonas sp. TaxID=2058762 RepID=UPI003F4A7F0D
MGLHNAFGRKGEQIAADFLKKKGYQILKQNYRFDKAEVDIIAKMNNFLVIVEVKTRTSEFLEDLSQTINPGKIKRLTKAANHYVLENDLDIEVRFDVMVIRKNERGFKVKHIEDAFHFF